jgi:hypothetical protein
VQRLWQLEMHDLSPHPGCCDHSSAMADVRNRSIAATAAMAGMGGNWTVALQSLHFLLAHNATSPLAPLKNWQ